MAVNSIYQLVFTQTFRAAGEEVSNVFFFRGKSGAPNAQDLLGGAMAGDSLRGKIEAWQSSDMKSVRCKVINLFDPADFYEGSVNSAGANSDSVLPAFNAVNFSLKLNTRGIRPGSKRFCGVTEDAGAAGVISNATIIGLLNDLGEALASDVLGADLTSLYEPIVVKRVEYTIDVGLDSEHQSYRLPANEGELNFGVVTAALVNLHVSHQVSRGNGR